MPDRGLGTIVVQAGTVARLRLAGVRLLTDARKLQRLRVPAGVHRLRVMTVAGQVKALEVQVLPDRETQLSAGDVVDLTSDELPVTGAGSGPWIVVGVSSAAAITGGILMALADGVRNVEPGPGEIVTSTTQREHESDWEGASGRWNAGIALVGIGAAGITAGLTWWLLKPKGEPSVWLTPTPNGVGVGARF